MDKRVPLIFLIFSIILLVLPQPPILGQESVTIEGTVREHGTGKPIPHAKILVIRKYYYRSHWRRSEIRWERVFHGEADSDSYFHLELKKEEKYIIYVYYNDSLTPGFDYVPAMKNIETSSDGRLNITFELWEGASMFLEGEDPFVETTGTPQSSYSVVEPDSGEVIKRGEYIFNYGEDDPHDQIPGISLSHFVVPADTPFKVEVESRVEVGGKTLTKDSLIDKPGHFVLRKGESIHVDIREYALPSSLSKVRAEASEIGLMIDEKEEEGFYLAVERQRFAQITSLILEAEKDLNQSAYEASFTKLRGAYIEISNLRNWLNSMRIEALMSVFVLISFLGFTATVTSFLLFEKNIQKIGGASAFYAAFLLALYLLYPGSRLVEAPLFIEASIISLLIIFGLSALLPRILKGRGVRGHVPLRNMVVPIFSIAKRSLRRRRFRFALTLLSVVILVSSFITLTSFTTGFGLTFRRVSRQPGSSTGVLVRAPKPPGMESVLERIFWFSPMDNSSIGWFQARAETLLVAPKYENVPLPQYPELYFPLGYVGRTPIFGIMGIIPSAEAEILRLNETIIEGRYLRDEDENVVLISAYLKEKLGVTVGESLTFRSSLARETLELEIIGILDDKRSEDLRDLDGQSPLPRKIIDTDPAPPDEVSAHIDEEVIPCSAEETLVVTCRTASRITGLWLSRLDIILEAGEDLAEYAKKMALNKGFRVWASTEEGAYLAQLASYFEGKGLPISIPWAIVVLNVVVTMLNALYERRSEIFIYSSIGMNPSHISGIFIAEVAIIGVLGGGIGYLLGLGWYKAMSLLALALQVRQKISALWVLAAIAVSMAAVLVGGLTALRGSVIITPSLKRRWSVEGGTSSFMEPLELTLPVRVAEAEAEEFVEYVVKALRSYREDIYALTSGIRESLEETEEASIRRIEFTYRSADMKFGGFYAKNKVILSSEGDRDIYTVKLLTQGTEEGVHKAGSFIRKIIMEWSVERGKL